MDGNERRRSIKRGKKVAIADSVVTQTSTFPEDDQTQDQPPPDISLGPSSKKFIQEDTDLNPDPSLLTITNVENQASEQSIPSQGSGTTKSTNAAKAEEVQEEEGADEEWMRNFTKIRLFLIIFGRWPLTYTKDSKGRYNFRFHWICPGFIFFLLTAIFTTYGLAVSSYNVVGILMREKISQNAEMHARAKTHILEQALLERHTIIVMIMLGSYGVNFLTSLMIFIKRDETAVTFTKWTAFLRLSKLSCGGFFEVYSSAGVTFLNYLVVSAIFVYLTIKRTCATPIGGPTVVSIMFCRHSLPEDYLENFTNSELHRRMHLVGVCLYFYVILTCNSYMYLFLYLLKSIDNAFFCWNLRTAGVVEAGYDEAKDGKPKKPPPTIQDMKKDRITYWLLYHDHIGRLNTMLSNGLCRMLSWFNNMFAFSLEPYFLFLTIKIVYSFYLAALVVGSNGKPLNKFYLGTYFVRKGDYVPALLFMYEDTFMATAMLYACAWLEDTTYESYEEMRKKTLLKGPKTDKEAFFYLSMFQSYTSTTRMAVYAAQYFCIDRYTVLHVLSAIMSNFLVVYQFRPLFDMDTTEFEALRVLVGNFLVSFEGLDEDHIIPVSDAIRNQASS